MIYLLKNIPDFVHCLIPTTDVNFGLCSSCGIFVALPTLHLIINITRRQSTLYDIFFGMYRSPYMTVMDTYCTELTDLTELSVREAIHGFTFNYSIFFASGLSLTVRGVWY